MSKDKACIVLTTCPNQEEARTLAQGLVSERLAACVQLTDIQSVYWWDNRVQQDPEVLLIIKTLCHRFHDVATYIQAHHSYEIPEIVQIPIQEGHTPYLRWLAGYIEGTTTAEVEDNR